MWLHSKKKTEGLSKRTGGILCWIFIEICKYITRSYPDIHNHRKKPEFKWGIVLFKKALLFFFHYFSLIKLCIGRQCGVMP